jgi:hypothetical protein
MNKRTKFAVITVGLMALVLASHAATILYQNDFEKEDLDKVPDGFLVLDGDYSVKQIGGNKVLELPGAPLDSFGVLFGPNTNGNLTVGARIFGSGKGRRFPTFAVGLNGGSGYKLQVSPAKGVLEIFHADASLASVPFKWKSGIWTNLRLRVQAAGAGTVRVDGKAWTEGAAEPSDWMVTVKQTEPSAGGRASLWGSPFSGTAIDFDEIVLTEE